MKTHRVLPGLGLSLGTTMLYLSLLVLLPLSTIFWKSGTLGWEHFKMAAFSARAIASYKITFGAAFAAAFINLWVGLLVAWVLVRYSFPGKGLIDALVDLPFALPTAVGGIALTTAYAPNGIIGKPLTEFVTRLNDSAFVASVSGSGFGVWLAKTSFVGFLRESGMSLSDFKIAYSPIGIVIALTFISLPFVVRTVQPVLRDLDSQIEEAASALGANRWMIFRRVIFPFIWPALVTGFALGFARAIGEYGSVVFIAGNQPLKTEITPLLIITRLEEYDYAGATALAVVMLVASFLLLFTINTLQRWTNRRTSAI